MARALFDSGKFMEVFVDRPIELCEQRDMKGLYTKARSDKLKNFMVIDSPYKAPQQPEIHLKTNTLNLNACVDQILTKIYSYSLLKINCY